ncbi:hypothetical protein LOD99_5079 [Oopsacas minuta]|uniref:SET domain-containing protein n=1 Tax=Oopsacas minuta TaxID=111878 RepID=A0AAV7JRE9_9METZ|nr:hypothetical protein LOD99_5079 [Oopsacas minuta]
MDWFGNEAKNLEFDKYIQELPGGDQDILREYFILIYTKYRTNAPVQDISQVLQEIIRTNIKELTDKRCLKITRIIKKAIEFSETLIVYDSTISHTTPKPPEHVSNTDPDDSNIDTVSVSEYNREGNRLFKNRKFREAILCYSKAIAIDPNNPYYYSNRAISHLKLEMFEEALSDAEEAISLDPQTSKYRIRLARAYAGLGDHKKYCDILEQLSDLSENMQATLEKEYKLAQNTRGKFDYKEMANNVKNGEVIEIGDFIGPVSIRFIGEQGNALFASKNIKKGEIILVTKAVAFTRSSSIHTCTTPVIPQAENNTDNKKLKLLNTLSRKAKHSKLTSHRLYHLYAREIERNPIPIELYSSIGYQVVRDLDCIHHTTADLDHIICYKSYSVFHDPHIAPRDTSREQRGVWYIPSFINHSCLPTAHQRFIGDISIIQANIDMNIDTEITLSYIAVLQYASVEERRRELLERWRFICHCELCEFESDARNLNIITRCLQLRESTQKIASLSNNPLQIIGPTQYKVLTDVIALAEEIKLNNRWFNAHLWQAIICLTKLKISPSDYSIYCEFIDKIKSYICDLELTHQLDLWSNCLSYLEYIQLHETNERRKDVDDRYQQVKDRYSITYKY